MSKTSLTSADGWTPLYDILVQEHGLHTAATFGLIWRYCQMRDGICRASIATLSRRLNISRMTVIRHIDILLQAGYLKDLSPDLRHRPHIYLDTGKAACRAPSVGISKNDTAESGITESDTTAPASVTLVDTPIPKSDPGYPSESHPGISQSDISKTIKRDKEEDEEKRKTEACRLWSIILGELAEEIGRANFNTWVRPALPLSWDGSTLTIATANDYARAWLTDRVQITATHHLQGITDVDMALIAFVVSDRS